MDGIFSLNQPWNSSNMLFGGNYKSLIVEKAPSLDRVRMDLEAYDVPILYLDSFGKITGFGFPPFFDYPLYWTLSQGTVLFSHDMFMLAHEGGCKNLDIEQSQYLLAKGYCAPLCTPCEQIRQFGGSSFYSVGSIGKLTRLDLSYGHIEWDSEESCYRDFKRRLNMGVDNYLERFGDAKHYLLLSGGADSRLIFLLLLTRKVHFGALSSLYVPGTFSDNASDVYLAGMLCERCGIKHNVSQVNLDLLSESFMREMVAQSPCGSHLSAGFRIPIAEFVRDDAVIWTGQNMDGLYSLGPSGRFSLDKHGLAQLLKRFYLSREYMSTLPDVKERGSKVMGWLALLAAEIFKIGYGDHAMTLPRNVMEYQHRFRSCDDYVVLRDDGVEYSELASPISASELKENLFKDKLAYIRGGDSQIICSSARLSNADVAFPFSTMSLVEWFNSCQLNYKDVVHPKRFVYRYIKELSSEIDPKLGVFRRRERVIPGIEAPYDLYGFMGNALESSLFREMRDVVGDNMETTQANSKKVLDDAHKVMRRYWLEVVRRNLE